MTGIVSFPFDEVLMLIAILAAVEDRFNFVFKLVFDLDRRRWGNVEAVDIVPIPWWEAVDVEYRVLVHRGGEV
jgi:hypothetical protein